MGRFAPSEMEIVDAFTHVIFCGADELSPEEASILDTLCRVDEVAASCSSGDFPDGVGCYLRALGVKEMIQLVTRVRDCYLLEESQLAQTQSPAGGYRSARH